MSAKAYKHIFDISVFYTIGAFLLSCIGDISVDSRVFPVLLIIMIITMLLERRRYLSLPATVLFPVALLPFLLPSIPDLVIFLLAWAYFRYVSITGRVVVSRGEFIDMLKRTAALLLLMAFLMLAVFWHISEAFLAACPYIITALISAVFLLRYLRLGSQVEQLKGYHRQQLLELLAFLAISLLLTLIKAPQNLLNGLQLIYLNLLLPIITLLGSILGLIVSGILKLLIALLKLVDRQRDVPEVNINFGKTFQQTFDATDTAVTDTRWVLPFLSSVGAIIGLILLFFFLRRLMGGKLKQLIPTGISETREYLEEDKHKQAALGNRRPKDSRAIVRYYYHKSLLWMQHKKVELKPQDTTEEIHDKCQSLIGKEATTGKETSAQLRTLYCKARYQVQEEISDEEAEEARQLYRELKRSSNDKLKS